VNLLREYLDEEFRTELPFGYDLERVIDDFVLFCFFVGTVPSWPSSGLNA
jgi:5'-3' exoribonuclease 1